MLRCEERSNHAWVALTIDMLRLAGDSRIADELELSTFNGILGAQHPSGRWWTYNTPMDGEHRASAHDIVFQARPGSPELNCCSVNAPRGIGMLSEWAMMVAKDGAVLNYYGPGTITILLISGALLTIAQETEYPLSGILGWMAPAVDALQVPGERRPRIVLVRFCKRGRIGNTLPFLVVGRRSISCSLQS